MTRYNCLLPLNGSHFALDARDGHMKIAMDMLCRVFSKALDIIEEEQIGASERHATRVAALCAAMGKRMGYDDDAISALATCAMFHDNALTEYSLAERQGEQQGQNMVLHCEKGQNNVSWMPFKNIDGFILYHHERGNGSGPFNKREGEYPFEAALIAAADIVDVTYHLQRLSVGELPTLRGKIEENAESYSTRAAINVLLEVLNEDMLEELRDENISKTLDCILPHWEVSLNDPRVIQIAGFLSHVIDYKSHFTRLHTSQIANRAWLMAGRYGYSQEESAALFLAASLHDIGKIAIPIEVLEKQGKLSDEEFGIIKQHVGYTHDWLSDVPGFDTIRDWAASHHEKLDGSGYPFGKRGDGMDFNSRLIACLDIYQAVSEPRPYHGPRSHTETMSILYDMTEKGLIDDKIVKDIDQAMEGFSMGEVPPP
jgi:HD-GYP domain-containing protein (c-di-GMP phosphodiesterase class II)